MPLIQRTHSFAKEFKAELGTEYADKLNALMIQWNSNLYKREEITSNAKSTIPEFEMIWEKTCKQLYKNMLTILLNNIENPNALFIYFDESLVNFHKHNAKDSIKLSIGPNSIKTAASNFDMTNNFLIINHSKKAVYYYGAAAADEQAKTTPFEIAAGDQAEVTALSLGAPDNKYLILQNKDAIETAEVEIALIH